MDIHELGELIRSEHAILVRDDFAVGPSLGVKGGRSALGGKCVMGLTDLFLEPYF